MATIIPRWEWRVFGDGFGAAEAAFAALTPGPVEESDELYLLSAAGRNVKVRDGLMDIKFLREVDADGLERWEPVMKAGLPAAGGRGVQGLRRARRRPASAAPERPTPWSSSSPSWWSRAVRCGWCGSTSGASATRSAAAWPRSPTWRRTAESRGRSRSSRRTPPRSSPPSAASAWTATVNTSYPRGLAALLAEGLALCGDRRRDELGQVPHRRARRGRAVADHRRPRRDHAARRGPRRQRSDLDRAAGADGGRDRGHGRGGETPRRARRPPRSAPPACGSPATATRSSRRSGPAPASPSR